MTSDGSSQNGDSNPEMVSCYRHAQRTYGALCARCNRPICPDCMLAASVGWQCPECVSSNPNKSFDMGHRIHRSGTLGSTKMTPMVIALIALNVVCFALSGFGRIQVLENFGLWPLAIYQDHQWYRLITSVFLHEGLEHIALNMVTLAIIGPGVEVVIGRTRFITLYLLAGLGGSVCSYLVSPVNEVSIGASGAIFGLMGAYFILARRHRMDINVVVVLIVLNLIFSFVVSGIDWRAHIGGLLTGAIVAVGFNLSDHFASQRSKVLALCTVCLGVFALLAVLALNVMPGQLGW